MSVPTSRLTGACAGVDSGGGGVERELPDGNAHSARALVPEPEDALVVGDDDQADVVEGRVAEDVGDAAAVAGRDPQAPRPSEDVAVLWHAPPTVGV